MLPSVKLLCLIELFEQLELARMRELDALKSAISSLETHVVTAESTMAAHVAAYIPPAEINSALASVNTLVHRLASANAASAIAIESRS